MSKTSFDQSVHSSPTDVFGYPRGLMYLCFAEGWERFSYFGMQTLLVLYMTHHLCRPENIGHVIGFDIFRSTLEHVTGPLTQAALASQIFGLYAGLVYLTPLIEGFFADRWLGRTLAVTIGAILMSSGHFLMAFEWSFLLALLFLLVGVGGFKGNITSQVGGLYAADDPRRATAYQLFQFSISTAVILSGLVCGTLEKRSAGITDSPRRASACSSRPQATCTGGDGYRRNLPDRIPAASPAKSCPVGNGRRSVCNEAIALDLRAV